MNQEILKALTVTAEVTGTMLSEAALTVMVNRLAQHGEADALQALQRCMDEVKHRLTLADVLERMPNRPPGAEEAWGIAVGAQLWNEELTTVVPRAVFEAFPFELWPDRIAARMAFKERYPDLAKKYGQEMKVSLGWDREHRHVALIDAIERRLLTHSQAIEVLPSLESGNDAGKALLNVG